jgi:hypothetical protein
MLHFIRLIFFKILYFSMELARGSVTVMDAIPPIGLCSAFTLWGVLSYKSYLYAENNSIKRK